MHVLLALTALAPVAAADEITDQIASAREAYEQKDYTAAIDDLNFAIAQIQEVINSQNATLLPEPLEGWSASEVENASGAMTMIGGGTNMTRTYQRDDERVEINLIANSPWVMGMMQMLSNPMLMAGNPNVKTYRHNRIKGMKETSEGEVAVTLAVAGQIVVKVTGRNLATEATIEQYLDAMDFDRIQSTLLQ
jgi:hypothetical protein